MGERSGSGRREISIRDVRCELCVGIRHAPRCRQKAKHARGPIPAAFVAATSCLTFLAALAISGYAFARGPEGFLPPDPRAGLSQQQLPMLAAAHHTIDDLFVSARP